MIEAKSVDNLLFSSNTDNLDYDMTRCAGLCQQTLSPSLNRSKQIVRLWLIFVIISLISEVIFHLTYTMEQETIWTIVLLWAIRLTCFAVGALWLGRGTGPTSRIVYGAAAFLMCVLAFRVGHRYIPASFTVFAGFVVATLATSPRFHVRRYKQVEIVLSALVVIAALAFTFAFRILDLSAGLWIHRP